MSSFSKSPSVLCLMSVVSGSSLPLTFHHLNGSTLTSIHNLTSPASHPVNMRERYSFRFLPEEIAEMRSVLEKHGYTKPLQGEMDELASSFSKIRQEQGMRCVRVESIKSWFKRRRNRGGYGKYGLGNPHERSFRSKRRSQSVQHLSLANEEHAAEDEASERSSSDEGSLEGEMSESMESEQGGSQLNIQCHDVTNSVDCVDMDTTLKPVIPPLLRGSLTEVDDIVRVESGQRSIFSRGADSSTLSKIGQAKAIMEELKGLSMANYRKYEEDIKLAVRVLLEEGGELLSETEKAELPLLPEKLSKIAQENVQVRKEIDVCGAFLEKIDECEENTIKLMEKARILEEKYKAFPQSVLTFPNKGDDLEASVAKAEGEKMKMKGDKEEVVVQLVKIAECLQSASTHHKILKAEEAAVIQKRDKLMESLQKNSEEWVKLTNSRTYISFR